jgi:hypothetical protein
MFVLYWVILTLYIYIVYRRLPCQIVVICVTDITGINCQVIKRHWKRSHFSRILLQMSTWNTYWIDPMVVILSTAHHCEGRFYITCKTVSVLLTLLMRMFGWTILLLRCKVITHVGYVFNGLHWFGADTCHWHMCARSNSSWYYQ